MNSRLDSARANADATIRELARKLSVAKKRGDAAKRETRAAKVALKAARKNFKRAKKVAKEAKKAIKALKNELHQATAAAAATERAAKAAAKKAAAKSKATRAGAKAVRRKLTQPPGATAREVLPETNSSPAVAESSPAVDPIGSTAPVGS